MSTSTENTENIENTTVVEDESTTADVAAPGEDSATDSVTEAAPAQDEQDGVEDGAEQADDAQESPRPSRRQARTEDLVREGEVAADFLEALLDIADLSGDLEVDIDGNRAAVAIVDSEDGVAPRRLVGPNGQVLDALQELTRLAVQAETGDRSWLMLDVAGFRADRKSDLVSVARKAIEEVKSSGEKAELEPMTAFERKVVHDEVLAAGLHSESEGAEPSRYVVILPAS